MNLHRVGTRRHEIPIGCLPQFTFPSHLTPIPNLGANIICLLAATCLVPICRPTHNPSAVTTAPHFVCDTYNYVFAKASSEHPSLSTQENISQGKTVGEQRLVPPNSRTDRSDPRTQTHATGKMYRGGKIDMPTVVVISSYHLLAILQETSLTDLKETMYALR